MPTPRAALGTTTNPLVLVALVWALLWGFGAGQITVPTEPAAPSGDQVTSSLDDVEAESLWRASWSHRFPGCVALVLWPQDEQPVALLARGPSGEVARVAATQRPARVVGACR